MPKFALKFTVALQKEFPFIKLAVGSEYEVLCTLCGCKFSIADGGKRQINQHVQTKKHAKATIAVKNAQPMSSFLPDDPAQVQLAGKEITFAYHSARHQMSGATVHCNSNLIKQLFEPKFTCGERKTAKLVRNVSFTCYFVKMLRNTYQILGNFSRNRPRYREVIKQPEFCYFANRLLKPKLWQDATSDGPRIWRGKRCRHVQACSEAHQRWKIRDDREWIDGAGRIWKISDKICAFAADNCNTNFGGIHRQGKNNVFFRLKQELGREIVGVGCASHIIHNAFDSACDQLPINIEAFAVNIYKHFRLHTVRVETLKNFCDEADVEYMKLVSHSGSRFLSLYPAIQKVKKSSKIFQKL